MTRHPDDDKPLPLPVRASPRDLDQRILRHARDNAPRRSGWQASWWMSGLATASILGVAVLIALPGVDTGTTAHPVGTQARPAPPASAPEPGRARQEALTDEASRSRAPVGQALDLEQDAMPASESRWVGSPVLPGTREQKATEGEAPGEPAGAKPVPKQVQRELVGEKTVPVQVRRELERLGAIAGDAARRDEAVEAYRELLEACPGCDLPATLEQALERYGIRTPQAPPVDE